MNLQEKRDSVKLGTAALWTAFGLCTLCAAFCCANPELLAREGQRLLACKRYRCARKVFRLLIHVSPMDRRGYEGAAEALVRLGQADLAFEVLATGAERIHI